MRPWIKIFGGKGRLHQFIISHFPNDYENMVYVEPFVGGGSVFLNKKRSITDVISDVNPEIINIVLYLKFVNTNNLLNIEYTEENFNLALTNKLGIGISELVKYRFSRGGMGKTFSYSQRLRGGIPGDENAWKTFKESIPSYCAKLQKSVVKNLSYDRLLDYDDENTFFYMDPPYLHSTRTSTNVYNYEWKESDHVQFLNHVTRMKSKVLISGYDSELYNTALQGWNTFTKSVPNNASQSKKKNIMVEKLWRNY